MSLPPDCTRGATVQTVVDVIVIEEIFCIVIEEIFCIVQIVVFDTVITAPVVVVTAGAAAWADRTGRP